jgi:hypothetical protein
MRSILLAIFLLINIPARVCAQNPYAYFNSDAFWNKFRFTDNPADAPQAGDTVIAVVSSRKYRKDAMPRFMSEYRESDTKALHYFNVWSRAGVWYIREGKSLSGLVSTLPQQNRDWVVYTEGMGKIFTSDVDRGLRLAGTYGVNVLLLDYPSIRTNLKSVRNYYFAIGNARAAHRYFHPVLDSVRLLRRSGHMGAGKLSLFFHSMGNNVMQKIAQSNNSLNALNGEKWVDNIILNAPCVKTRGHSKWVQKIRFANGVAVNYNPQDRTLKWARIISAKKQLGDRLRGPLAPDVLYVNFNTLTGDNHTNFLSLPGRGPVHPAAFDYYNALLHGSRLQTAAPKFRPGGYRGLGLDIMPE